jgi:hypothetical protein
MGLWARTDASRKAVKTDGSVASVGSIDSVDSNSQTNINSEETLE